MTDEEWNLSDYVTEEPQISYIPTFKVREFIRRLKEKNCRCRSNFNLKCEFCGELDKLAGEKLK